MYHISKYIEFISLSLFIYLSIYLSIYLLSIAVKYGMKKEENKEKTMGMISTVVLYLLVNINNSPEIHSTRYPNTPVILLETYHFSLGLQSHTFNSKHKNNGRMWQVS